MHEPTVNHTIVDDVVQSFQTGGRHGIFMNMPYMDMIGGAQTNAPRRYIARFLELKNI